MSAEPTVNEWADFMPQSVMIEPWTGYTGGGAGATYGSAYFSDCRVEMGNHLVVDRQGRTITARGKIFLLSTILIDVKDRITLPEGYVPRQTPLIDVNIVDDELGNHHITLELQ
jgi:hypothetical protein